MQTQYITCALSNLWSISFSFRLWARQADVFIAKARFGGSTVLIISMRINEVV